jgi:hypothetical protein
MVSYLFQYLRAADKLSAYLLVEHPKDSTGEVDQQSCLNETAAADDDAAAADDDDDDDDPDPDNENDEIEPAGPAPVGLDELQHDNANVDGREYCNGHARQL